MPCAPSAPTALAIDRHDIALGQGRQHAAHPAAKALLQRRAIEQTKEATQRVVRRNPVLQHQKAA